MEIVKNFFDFEMRNGLFDIVDQYGLRPWESIRGEVMEGVLYPSSKIKTTGLSPNGTKHLWKSLAKFFCFCFYLINHLDRKYLFFLCSRDHKNGKLYDKISDSLYTMVNQKDCFTIESWNSYSLENYKYGSDVIPNYSQMLAKVKHYSFDYTEIYQLLKQEFPNSSITLDMMNNCYNNFVCEYKFYKFILKICHVKKVFMVQNGFQKGMFAAANELGVNVMELQHGQLSFNHMAYSYPNNKDLPASKIYHPNYLLTFGSFWTKNRCYPGVENIALGNNSYGEVTKIPNVHGNKKLLVISNKTEGPLLADRVVEVLKKDPTFSFVFKLHPHQYNELDEYRTKFVDDSRVEVVSNQQAIDRLLSQCEGVFLNDSTVELEALHLGRKVFVLTEQDYMCMDFVFGEEGVYLCKDVDEFLAVYEKNKDVTLAPRDDLFMKFDENVARKVIQL